MSPVVVAFDLSLTGTGVAAPSGARLLAPGGRGPARLAAFRAEFHAILDDEDPDLVAVEEYAFHARGAHSHQLGELGGVLRLAAFDQGRPLLAIVPSTLKRYATGRGNAPKAEVLAAAIRRLGYDGHDDNVADALWLRALALDALGCPLVGVPAAHRDALAKVVLPEEVRRGC